MDSDTEGRWDGARVGARAVALLLLTVAAILAAGLSAAAAAKDGGGKGSKDRAGERGQESDGEDREAEPDAAEDEPERKRRGGGHLLLVPNTKDARRAIEKAEALVLAEYEAFLLVEADGDEIRRLEREGAEVRDDLREVTLGGETLDPTEERESDDLDLGDGERGLAVVQFVGPVKDKWLERLRDDGVRAVAYVPENAYVVSGRGRALERLRAEAREGGVVRAVVPYTADDKLAGGLDDDDDPPAVAVQTLSGSAGEDAREVVAEKGRALRAPSDLGGRRTQFVALEEGGDVEEIAEQPGVVAVEPYSPPRLSDERASQIAAGNVSGSGQPVLGTGYLWWLVAAGFGAGTFDFAIDVTDEGLVNGKIPGGHPDFFVDGDTAKATRIAYISNYTDDRIKKRKRKKFGPGRDCGGHGTINASIAAGHNGRTGATYEDSGAFNYGLGVAPRVRIGASKVFRCSDAAFDLDGSFGNLTSNAYGRGARIANNSWGATVNGFYNSDAFEFDRLVRDAQAGVAGNQEMVEVFAAGNQGERGTNSIDSPATAKNVIAVGASEGVRDTPRRTDGCNTPDSEADNAFQVPTWSARGPSDDLRIKPDLVAPGSHITGAQPKHGAYNGSGVCDKTFPSGSELYSLSSGTSHSTAVVSGAAALLRDAYGRAEGEPPSPAMTKAILISSATDIETDSPPSSVQGWGLANLGAALGFADRDHRDQETLLTTTGTQEARSYAIADSSRPVRVTLVWTDVPGASLVNNLDLEVVHGTTTYRGNGGAVADTRNNVERVVLPANASGGIQVRVRATNLAGDGVPGSGDATDQDFALVVSNVD